MKANIARFTGLTLLASAFTLIAQNDPQTTDDRDDARGPRHGPRPPLAGRFFQALDTDENRALSFQELAGLPAWLLNMDQNQDGQLTPDEVRPPRRGAGRPEGAPDRPRRGGQTDDGAVPPRKAFPPALALFDVNQDAVLGADEIAGSAGVMQRLDTNNDGQLAPDEIRAAHVALQAPAQVECDGSGQDAGSQTAPAQRPFRRGPRGAR